MVGFTGFVIQGRTMASWGNRTGYVVESTSDDMAMVEDIDPSMYQYCFVV